MKAESPAASAGSAARPSPVRRVLRWLFGTLATLIVVLALAFGTARVLLVQVPEYRDQIQAWVNDTTRLDFRFRGLDARWRFYGPELYVTEAELFVPDGGPLLAKARAASIGVDLWRVLFRAELFAGRIRLIEPEIELLRTADGRLELAGQAALDPRDESRFNVNDLPTGLLEIVGARVRFEDQRGEWQSLDLNGVQLSVERDRDDVALEGEIELPERLGGALEFLAAARGSLDEPRSLAWRIELSGEKLALAGWREFFGRAFAMPASGSGSLRLSAALEGMRLVSGALQLRLSDVVLAATTQWPVESRYRVLAGNFDLLRMPQGWRLKGRDVDLSTATQRWQRTECSIEWSAPGQILESVEASAAYLRAESVLPLIALAPAAAWRERVLQLSPEGELREARLSYARRENGVPRFNASARLSGVGFNPLDWTPGLRGLSGELNASDTAGRAQIDSKGLLFIQPRMFRGPLAADVARGEVTWMRDERGLRIATRQFLVHNAHAHAMTDVELLLPGDGESPVLRLDSRFRDAVLVEGWRYLPINKLGDKTLAWLDAAFLAGHAPAGEFVFNGPTDKFPFREGEGEFRISFPVEGMKLHYAEGWPDIETIAADIEFRNAGLTGTIRAGSVNGLAIESGTAQFADFRQAELAIKAQARGDLGSALTYLQSTPVGEVLGRTFMDLRARGDSAVEVDLLLPVTHLEDRKVDVLARIDRGSVTLLGTGHVLDGLQGSLRVQNRQVSSPTGFGGSYLGGPIRIDLAAEPTARPAENVIRAYGQTPGPELAAAMNIPETVGLGGIVDWRSVARMPIDPGSEAAARPATLRVDTNLKGTSIGLPAPLAKPAVETRPLRIDVQWPAAAQASVRASYGGNVRTQLQLARRDGAWQLTRGVMRFGEGDLRLPTGGGLEIRGALDAVDLSEWFALRSGKNSPGTRALADYLRSTELSVRELALFGFRFPQVNASLLAGERAWVVSVDSPRARGTLLVPYDFAGSEPLVLNLARLSIGEAEDPSAPAAQQGADSPAAGEDDPDPRDWPSVRVAVGEFEAWGKRLGFLRTELVRVPDGLRLDSFSAQSASFSASGNGSWTVTPEGARGALKFKVESTDVLTTLQELGYGGSLTGQRGVMDADLRWPGAPNATLAKRLSGTVRVEVDDGRLLNLQPGGAGRVFGLMSVSALRRRLSLDFSDFVSKGLSYDNIRGDFRIESGDAFTENLLLKGPTAEIGIVGRTGLDARDYDQTAVVTGSIGSSLPVVGALAGGPVVGAGLLLFSQIFKGPLKGIARGYYRITGPWENPTVQRIESAEGKKAEEAVRTAEGSREAG